MKKSIFLAVIGSVAAVVAYGQGQINFGNYYLSTQTTGIYYGDGPDANLYCGPEISVQLLYGVSTATSVSQLSPIGNPISLGVGLAKGPGPAGPGSVSPNNAGVFNGTLAANSLSPGTTYAFAYYMSGALSGVEYTGYSTIGVASTTASATAAMTFLPDSIVKGSFAVMAVPEPTTLALGGLGLGLAALGLLRRKKVTA